MKFHFNKLPACFCIPTLLLKVTNVLWPDPYNIICGFSGSTLPIFYIRTRVKEIAPTMPKTDTMIYRGEIILFCNAYLFSALRFHFIIWHSALLKRIGRFLPQERNSNDEDHKASFKRAILINTIFILCTYPTPTNLSISLLFLRLRFTSKLLRTSSAERYSALVGSFLCCFGFLSLFSLGLLIDWLLGKAGRNGSHSSHP